MADLKLVQGFADGRREPKLGGGGGSGDNGGMEIVARVAELEKTTKQMQIDVAVVRSNYATKSDVAEATTRIIMWVVGAIIFAQVLPALPNILRAFGVVN